MMRIGINARILAKPDPAGIGNYTCHLLTSMCDLTDDVTFVIFGVGSLPDGLADRLRIENAGATPTRHSGLRAQVWEQCRLPLAVSGHNLDLLHTTGGFPPLGARLPQVTTLHDISPVTHPEWFSRPYVLHYRTLLPLTVLASDELVTISEFSRDEIVGRYPRSADKIHVVHNGVTPPDRSGFEPLASVADGQFLLFVGSINPRKNIAGLLRSYRLFRERTDHDVPLVLAGSYRDVFSEVDHPEVPGVYTPGYVSDSQLRWLYDNATAFLYPSLYEGFGLPILEAMSWETPVLTSDRGAMAEVAADAALLVDPADPDSMAAGIERLVTDADLRETLRTRGRERCAALTWERTARQTLRVYEKTLDRDSGRADKR